MNLFNETEAIIDLSVTKPPLTEVKLHYTQFLYQIWSIIVIIYTFGVLFKISVHKEKDSWFIVLGASALLLTIINDITFLSTWMNDNGPAFLRSLLRTGNLSSVGQLIFAFTNSLLLAKKFSYSLEQEEIATAKLTEMNKNLDKIVMHRTEALIETVPLLIRHGNQNLGV